MLTDTEVQIFPRAVIGFEISRALERQSGLVRRTKVGRATKKPRNVLRQNVQHFAGGISACDAFGICREHRKIAVPLSGKLAPLHLLNLGGELRILGSIGGKKFCPMPPRIGAARADTGGKMFVDAVGHKKLGILGPAVEFLSEANLV